MRQHLVYMYNIYDIPSKFALIKYVLECASDVGCCMKPAKTILSLKYMDVAYIQYTRTCTTCVIIYIYAHTWLLQTGMHAHVLRLV